MSATSQPEDGLDTSRPFTRADAVAAGIDAKLLRGSRFRRIFRGVYVHGSTPDSPFVRAEAALRLHPPGAFASHVTAARLYDLPVPHCPDEHVSVPRQEDRRGRPGLRSHVAGAAPTVLVNRGVRVSHPFQMFVELGSVLSLVDLVIVGDALLRVFKVEAHRLVAFVAGCRERYSGRAREAASLVRNEVDSPMETRLRLLIVLPGCRSRRSTTRSATSTGTCCCAWTSPTRSFA